MDNNSTKKYLHIEKISFSWIDYFLFTFIIIISVIVGIYFGCFGKKQKNANEYLLGGKKMKLFPIAISLVASHVSGLTLLAVPADVYNFGITYWLSSFAVIVAAITNAYVFYPVFQRCQVTSTYEYLKLRFDWRVQRIGSFIFATSFVHYLPIVVYIPALAFAQVSGIQIYYIAILISVICVFYTTIGGLKTVVWTDTLQFGAMIVGIVTITIIGVKEVGGIAKTFSVAMEGGRLTFDYDISPFKQNTFPAAFIGLIPSWILFVGVHQNSVQKCLALNSVQEVKKAMIIFSIGMLLIKACCVFIGLLIYARYYDCDPFTTKAITAHDQLVPLFTMDVAGKFPGLPGLFIAGIFCAALSTLSAYMNCLAGTIYEDFISPFVSKNVSQITISNILKVVVIIIGLISTGMIFIVEQLGGLFPLALSLSGITYGPLLGIFSLGMLVPMANTKGALIGGISSLVITTWMVIGAQWCKLKGYINTPKKNISIDGCYYEEDELFSNQNHTLTYEDTEVFILYRISYYYYTLIGFSLVFLIAIPISWFTKESHLPINRDLISPICHWMLPTENNDYTRIKKGRKKLFFHNRH